MSLPAAHYLQQQELVSPSAGLPEDYQRMMQTLLPSMLPVGVVSYEWILHLLELPELPGGNGKHRIWGKILLDLNCMLLYDCISEELL